eukprot:m.10045 g.10045  ORF g.10045 m.10045 type:complete len:109 (+) comp5913_c0_seq1:2047-2373(+)
MFGKSALRCLILKDQKVHWMVWWFVCSPPPAEKPSCQKQAMANALDVHAKRMQTEEARRTGSSNSFALKHSTDKHTETQEQPTSGSATLPAKFDHMLMTFRCNNIDLA